MNEAGPQKRGREEAVAAEPAPQNEEDNQHPADQPQQQNNQPPANQAQNNQPPPASQPNNQPNDGEPANNQQPRQPARRGEYFTIPAFARTRVFEGELLAKVRPLPLEDPTPDDPEPYAVRLCAPFADAGAILLGERLFVVKACERAAEIICIRAADRDPLLVFRRLSAVPLGTPVSQRIRFVEPPAVTLNLGELPSPSLFFVVQTLCGTPAGDQVSLQVPGATVTQNPFKNHAVACVPGNRGGMMRSSASLAVFPRSWLLRSDRAAHTATVRCQKTADAATVAKAMLQIPGARPEYFFAQSRAMLRIGFAGPTSEEQLRALTATPGVSSIAADNAPTRAIRSQASEKEAQKQREERQATRTRERADELRIRRLDGAPLDAATASCLAKALGLEKPRVFAGLLFGRSSRAAEFHEVVVNSLFAVFWAGAPPEPQGPEVEHEPGDV